MQQINPDMVVKTLIKDLQQRSRAITYEDIAAETNLTFDWIRKFCNGKIQQPPFDRVCRLYAYIYKTNTISL